MQNESLSTLSDILYKLNWLVMLNVCYGPEECKHVAVHEYKRVFPDRLVTDENVALAIWTGEMNLVMHDSYSLMWFNVQSGKIQFAGGPLHTSLFHGKYDEIERVWNCLLPDSYRDPEPMELAAPAPDRGVTTSDEQTINITAPKKRGRKPKTT